MASNLLSERRKNAPRQMICKRKNSRVDNDIDDADIVELQGVRAGGRNTVCVPPERVVKEPQLFLQKIFRGFPGAKGI